MTEPFNISRDQQGRLILQRPGQPDVVDVRIRRSFPWSRPSQFTSLRDSTGKELLMIENMADLPADVAAFVQNELTAGSFIPKIDRVEHVDVRFGFQQWRVKTDRGPIEFRVQEREDIRFMPDGRFCVKDADGNLYEMKPLDKLDDHSRRAIEALI